MNKNSGLKMFVAILILLIIGSIAIIYAISLVMQFDKGFENIDYTFTGFKTLEPVFNEMRVNETYKKGVLSVLGVYALFLFYMFFNKTLNVGYLRKKGTKYGPARVETGEHGNAKLLSGNEVNGHLNYWKTNRKLKKGGVVFGMRKTFLDTLLNRETIYLEKENAHSLIIGTTRTGKSRRIFLPSIWALSHSGESMVITDPKGELRAYTEPYLRNKGYNIITFNLRNIQTSNTFNPMDRVNREINEYKRIMNTGRTDQRYIAKEHLTTAERYARDLGELIVNRHGSGATGDARFWESTAKGVITTLILYVSMDAPDEKNKTLRNVYAILAKYGKVDMQGNSRLNDLMLSLDESHPSYLMWMTPDISSNKTKPGIFVSALDALQIFIDGNVALLTATQDHSFKDIVEKPTAVFLIVPDDISGYDFITTLYVERLYQELMSIADKTGKILDRRVTFFLDEFGNMPKLLDFAKKITIAGGRRIRFVLAVQGLQQIKSKYEKDFETIKGNCHSIIYIASQDKETAKEISERIGNYTIRVENIGSSISGISLGTSNSSASSNFSLTGRAVLMPDQVLKWDEEDGSLVLQIRKQACHIPLPDLSAYQANKDFGLGNEEHNKRVTMQREEMYNQITGEIKELPKIWYAGMDEEYVIGISMKDKDVLDNIYGKI